MNSTKTLVVTLLVLFAAAVGFAGGLLVGRPGELLRADGFLPVTGGPTVTQTAPQQLNSELVEQAYKLIQENYADQETLRSTNLTYAAISGMIAVSYTHLTLPTKRIV